MKRQEGNKDRGGGGGSWKEQREEGRLRGGGIGPARRRKILENESSALCFAL